ncbi:MAG: endonuclease/exonuclease/phosphatase family protein [Friedmanniella sp.]
MRTGLGRLGPRPSGGSALPVLVAVLTLVTLELVRASGPLVDLALTRAGVQGAATTALVSYLAAGLVAALLLLPSRSRTRSLPRARAVLLLGAGLLAALRLLAQALQGGPRFGVGLAAVAVAVAVLTLAVAVLAARPGGGRSAAGAVAAGAAAGVGLQLALLTWDAFWRHTVLGWTVTVAVVAVLVGSAVLAGRDPETSTHRTIGRLWALGPLLALAAMMLANPAFAASQSGLPLRLAGPLHAGGLLLAGALVLLRPPRRAAVQAALLVLAVACGLRLGGVVPGDGVLVLVALLVAQLAAVGLLGAALQPAEDADLQSSRRAAPGPVPLLLPANASLVGMLTIAPLLLYQLHYDVPLGVPNDLVIVLTAAALAGAGLRPSRSAGEPLGVPPTARLLAGCAAAALIGSGVAITGWPGERPAAAAAVTGAAQGSGVVLTWNVHYGVSPEGSVDLEVVARTIEAQDPDVVLLQEVSRGWVQGGGVDLASWLGHRLGRHVAFAPAADRRFGNLILTRSEPVEVRRVPLPYGQGPQRRSAVAARVQVGSVTAEVASVHLQHRPGNTSTRLTELRTLLAALAVDDRRGAPVIVGGDLNAGPGRPEPVLLAGAGFVSALDAAGDRRALTDPSTRPPQRIDWIFGRGIGFREAEVVADARSSDHQPVVARIAS